MSEESEVLGETWIDRQQQDVSGLGHWFVGHAGYQTYCCMCIWKTTSQFKKEQESKQIDYDELCLNM